MVVTLALIMKWYLKLVFLIHECGTLSQGMHVPQKGFGLKAVSPRTGLRGVLKTLCWRPRGGPVRAIVVGKEKRPLAPVHGGIRGLVQVARVMARAYGRWGVGQVTRIHGRRGVGQVVRLHGRRGVGQVARVHEG